MIDKYKRFISFFKHIKKVFPIWTNRKPFNAYNNLTTPTSVTCRLESSLGATFGKGIGSFTGILKLFLDCLRTCL